MLPTQQLMFASAAGIAREDLKGHHHDQQGMESEC